jgi:hypothetical protein
MLVHLVGSLRNLDEDVEYLKTVIETVHDHSASIAHNWLEPAVIRAKDNIYTKDWTPFVQNNMDALQRCHVVIIDATHYSFSHGYQMAAALDHKKPVLIVSRDPAGDKYKYLSGFTNSLLTYEKYSSNTDLMHTVSSFLKKNTIHTKDLRFNIMLTRKLFRYLDEKSSETGKNKSEIIRAIIKKHDDIRKSDG